MLHGTFSSYTVLTLVAVNGGFIGNDIPVPIPSGLGSAGGYSSLVGSSDTYGGIVGRNHSSIGDAGVGRDARAELIRVEQRVGDLTP
jgi:hypothetical protein